MKTLLRIGIISLKLLRNDLPQRYGFRPVIRPAKWHYPNDWYFAEYSFIDASCIKGLKKLVYRAKRRRMYCSYRRLEDNFDFIWSTYNNEEITIETVRKTIKGVTE